jgi:hypothetical protein
MPFTTLTDDEERELHRLQRVYWREALSCEESKAHLAGWVMLGSALETLLILMVNVYADEAEQTGQAPQKNGQIKPLLAWNLAELLKVAKAANWLPAGLDLSGEWSGRKARVGDHAEVVRMVRNLVHPARFVADHPRGRVTSKFLQHQFEVMRACRDWLADRNNRSLIEHMKAEGIMQTSGNAA